MHKKFVQEQVLNSIQVVIDPHGNSPNHKVAYLIRENENNLSQITS